MNILSNHAIVEGVLNIEFGNRLVVVMKIISLNVKAATSHGGWKVLIRENRSHT